MQVKRTLLISDFQLEFPNLNQYYYGHKARYMYLAWRPRTPTPPTDPVKYDNVFLNGVIKFDMQEDKVVKQLTLGDTHTGGELYYQQRDGSDPSLDEDDGYLMTFVYDWSTDQSQFVMWDAKTMECVLKADLGVRVPNGFHGTFVHETDY